MWSEWSTCSRSCCLGVRCRSCLKKPCDGHATELCNTNVCSGKNAEAGNECYIFIIFTYTGRYAEKIH